jgi:3-oxoacyl-[acyl-carrier protein] reductase
VTSAPPAPRGTALVTGGTRGIGLGIAQALAGDGWNLALCGVRPEESVRAVIDTLREHNVEVEYWAADVGSRDDRARLVHAVQSRFGVPHALVNNAGRAPRVRLDLLDATEESFEDLIRTNLKGPYFLTQAIARGMTARSSGTIVFVTSVSAEMVSPQRGEYCVSKAGLAMAARLYAARLAPHGVAVYEVRPGIVATDMTAAVRDVYDRRIADGLIPEGRWGAPADVGRIVAALVRGDMPYATGSVIHVDGGLAIPRL